MVFTGCPGDPAHGGRDVIGRHRLEQDRWETDGPTYGGLSAMPVMNSKNCVAWTMEYGIDDEPIMPPG